jgi:hypothetical protein
MTEQPTTMDDTPPGGLVVAGPWAGRGRTRQADDTQVLEPTADDVLDATPVGTSRWQERLSTSASTPVAPLVFRDPAQALATTRYVAREATRMAVREVLRPWQVLRVLPPIGRGLWSGLRIWHRWVAAHDVRDDHVRRPGVRVAGRDEIRDNRRFRLAVSGGLVATTSIGELVGYLIVGLQIPTLTGTVILAAAWWAGRTPRPEGSTVVFGAGVALRPGVPLGILAKQVVASLDDSKVPAEIAAPPVEHRWGWTVPVVAEDEITDKAIRALERRLRARRASITPIADPDNAAQTMLRIVHTDLLAQVGAPPAHKPLSLTITQPADLGRVMDGDHLIVELLRVHALLVGGTGSGKSSALWTILDYLTACRDVVVYGIDLTGGPVFRAWGGTIRRVATTAEDARDLLEQFIRLSKARADRLGERSEPHPDGPPPGDENWNPAADGPAYVLVIDEYPVLADARIDGKPARLADLVTTLERIGRKTATQAFLAAQRAGKGDLGNTTVKAMTEVQVLLPCSAGDVDMLWPGRRVEGWRPDLLKGASGRRPNDAGKLYINAAGHDEPRTSRFYRLELAEIHRRALARMKAGMPAPDDFSARAFNSDTDISDLVVREIPKILADLLDAFDVHQADRLPSAALVGHLVEIDPDSYPTLHQADTEQAAKTLLAALLAPHGLAPVQLGGPGNPRGYRRAAVEQAAAGETEEP